MTSNDISEAQAPYKELEAPPAKPKQDGKGMFGLLAMVMSSFLFSLMALLVKCLTQFSTFDIVFWRSVFMFVICIIVLTIKRVNPLGCRKDLFILVMRGVAGFGFMGFFYFAIKSLPLSDAVVITYTSPVLAAVAAAVILKEAWGKLDALGSMLSLTGVILISKPTFVVGFFGVDVAPLPPLGTLGAVFAAVSATCTYLLLRYARHLDPFVSTNYFAMVGIVLSPLFGVAFGETWHWPEGSLTWVQLVLLAVLSVAGQACMNMGLAFQTAAKATAMNYIQVVFAFIFQTLLLHEGSDTLSVVGAVLISSWGVVALLKELHSKRAAAREVDETHCHPEPFLKT